MNRETMNWTEICRGCGKCCGIVPFMPDEFDKVKHRAVVSYEIIPFLHGSIVPETKDGFCVFLERLNKRCSIYLDRPNVCRLQGTIPELPCPRVFRGVVA